MKKTVIFVACILNTILIMAQDEIKIESKIKKVVVYPLGAHVERKCEINLQSNTQTIKLTGLSSKIHEQSIRVEGDGNYKILNVKYELDFLNEANKDEDLSKLFDKRKELLYNKESEETKGKIIIEKLGFLTANKEAAVSSENSSPETFNQYNQIYGDQIEQLFQEKLECTRRINNLKNEIQKTTNQIELSQSLKPKPTGVILVTLHGENKTEGEMKLTYMVDEASWKPLYDIRFVSTQKPVEITYKANIKQNTGTNWDNVELVLSTAKTNLSADIPKQELFYLKYYYPGDLAFTEALQGKAYGVEIVNSNGDQSNNSNTVIRGAASIKQGDKTLFVVDGVPFKGKPVIPNNEIASVEVLKGSSASVYGASAGDGVVLITTVRNNDYSSVPTSIKKRFETISEYVIPGKNTIESSGQSNTISYKEDTYDASFEYQSLPDLSQNMYLVGKISNWSNADLLEGKANIYLENAFIGKSYLNPRQFSDTLEVSFGIDNGIDIKKEKLPELSETQFLSSNKRETHAYKITVRNNKGFPIKAKIIGQIPLSTSREIQVNLVESSDAILNKEDGSLKWYLNLEPGETKESVIKYTIKYPLDKQINID